MCVGKVWEGEVEREAGECGEEGLERDGRATQLLLRGRMTIWQRLLRTNGASEITAQRVF